ncbi:MAG: chemotaxis protein CheB [Proteobacteria bacterium]|nr:MAG: chemotaxis protein CheB [Pseudomonadota bacterium]
MDTLMPDNLITIGGSAGAIPSIIELLKELPKLPNAAICIAIHVPSHSPSLLPQIFANSTSMPVMHAQDGLRMRAGSIYIAPPDFHLLIKDGSIQLARGAKENHHRPAIDPMFRSAANAYGTNHIAVLLSGYLDDGSAGLLAVKRSKGTVIVQDPKDTIYPDMPRNALEFVEADCVCRLDQIVPFIMKRLKSEPASKRTLDPLAIKEIEMVKITSGDSSGEMPGAACGLVCPECSGPLWEILESDSHLVRYRCHEGHAYSALSLEASQDEELEAALWTALRAMDEKVELAEKLAQRAKIMGQDNAVLRYQSRHSKTREQADLLRKLLKEGLTHHKV